jgi:membrane protease YdiL (CAAX protease family)
MKIKDYLPWCEPFLLFFVLFFPAVFTKNASLASFFTSNTMMINYIIISIPQILIILYFFHIKKWNLKINFTLSNILKTIFFVILYIFLLLIIANSAVLILKIAGFMQNAAKMETQKQFIVFYLLVSLITGYKEELFFRAYLINFFEKITNETMLTIAISAMFAICHIAQGVGGITVSFLNSIVLCFIFFRHRNIHINAISHAVYNFLVLMASVFTV